MNHSKNLNYTFEEIEILKVLATFPQDLDKALDFIAYGLNYYELTRVENVLAKFYTDEIWYFEELENGKYSSTLNIDVKDLILSYPNPIPESIISEIDVSSVIEKLSASNLNLAEINYIKLLLKRDALARFRH